MSTLGATSLAPMVGTQAKALALEPSRGPARADSAQQVEQAAGQFEELLVRQLLGAAGFERVGGPHYGSMIVDALASAVAQGGGIGLKALLTDALHQGESSAHRPRAKTSGESP